MVVQAKTRDKHPYIVRHTHFVHVRIQKAKKKKDAINSFFEPGSFECVRFYKSLFFFCFVCFLLLLTIAKGQ
jgi:hypothetical protein